MERRVAEPLDAGRVVTAILRPAKRPKGREIAAPLRRLIREIRSHGPRVEIRLRGDGQDGAPEALDLGRAPGVDVVVGRPGTNGLRRRIATLEGFPSVGRTKENRQPIFYQGWRDLLCQKVCGTVADIIILR